MFDKLVAKLISILPQSLQKLYYKYESIFLYIFFGALTTAVSISVQYAAIWLGAPTVVCTSVSWICAVTFAFFTNKNFVFKSVTSRKRDFFSQMISFYGARLVSYFMELVFLLVTVDYFLLDPYIMKIIAQVFILTTNYLLSRFVIFKKKRHNDTDTENKES